MRGLMARLEDDWSKRHLLYYHDKAPTIPSRKSAEARHVFRPKPCMKLGFCMCDDHGQAAYHFWQKLQKALKPAFAKGSTGRSKLDSGLAVLRFQKGPEGPDMDACSGSEPLYFHLGYINLKTWHFTLLQLAPRCRPSGNIQPLRLADEREGILTPSDGIRLAVQLFAEHFNLEAMWVCHLCWLVQGHDSFLDVSAMLPHHVRVLVDPSAAPTLSWHGWREEKRARQSKRAKQQNSKDSKPKRPKTEHPQKPKQPQQKKESTRNKNISNSGAAESHSESLVWELQDGSDEPMMLQNSMDSKSKDAADVTSVDVVQGSVGVDIDHGHGEDDSDGYVPTSPLSSTDERVVVKSELESRDEDSFDIGDLNDVSSEPGSESDGCANPWREAAGRWLDLAEANFLLNPAGGEFEEQEQPSQQTKDPAPAPEQPTSRDLGPAFEDAVMEPRDAVSATTEPGPGHVNADSAAENKADSHKVWDDDCKVQDLVREHKPAASLPGPASSSSSSNDSSTSTSSSSDTDVGGDGVDSGGDAKPAKNSGAASNKPTAKATASSSTVRKTAVADDRAEFENGSIRYNFGAKNLVAHCVAHGGNCRRTRTVKPSAKKGASAKAQGRPIGHLAAWLSQANNYDDAQQHSSSCQPSRQERKDARQAFYDSCADAKDFADKYERKKDDDESDEPQAG